MKLRWLNCIRYEPHVTGVPKIGNANAEGSTGSSSAAEIAGYISLGEFTLPSLKVMVSFTHAFIFTGTFLGAEAVSFGAREWLQKLGPEPDNAGCGEKAGRKALKGVSVMAEGTAWLARLVADRLPVGPVVAAFASVFDALREGHQAQLALPPPRDAEEAGAEREPSVEVAAGDGGGAEATVDTTGSESSEPAESVGCVVA